MKAPLFSHLKHVRSELGLTQRKLAQLLGVSLRAGQFCIVLHGHSVSVGREGLLGGEAGGLREAPRDAGMAWCAGLGPQWFGADPTGAPACFGT